VILGVVAACVLVGCGSATPHTSVRVPRLSPGYIDQAMERLRAVGLKAAVDSLPPIRRGSWNHNGYVVTNQSPRAGAEVGKGTAVRLTLGLSLNASGPWPDPPNYAVVPDVGGWSLNVAYITLTAPNLGLLATVRDGDYSAELQPFTRGLIVTRTVPQAGTKVRSGTEVVLVVTRS
jgi:hypothetical protein